MSKTATFLSIALAALTLIPIAPASAQSFFVNNRIGFGNDINVRQRTMISRINTLRARGMLTPGEYSRLMSEFNTIASQEAMLRMNGLNFRERAILQQRLANLDQRIIMLGHNGNRQYASRWHRGWF
jgi:hypothetical protein